METYILYHEFASCCDAEGVVGWLLAVFLRLPDCNIIINVLVVQQTCILAHKCAHEIMVFKGN